MWERHHEKLEDAVMLATDLKATLNRQWRDAAYNRRYVDQRKRTEKTRIGGQEGTRMQNMSNDDPASEEGSAV